MNENTQMKVTAGESQVLFPIRIIGLDGTGEDVLIASAETCPQRTTEGLVMTDQHDNIVHLAFPTSHYAVTAGEYRVPLRIEAVARTDSSNLRLYLGDKGRVVLNSEANEVNFYIKHPMTRAHMTFDQHGPLEPGRWYRLSLTITERFMRLEVDGEVYAECPGYFVDWSGTIGFGGAFGARVGLREMAIFRLKPETSLLPCGVIPKVLVKPGADVFMACLLGCAESLNLTLSDAWLPFSEAILYGVTGQAFRSKVNMGPTDEETAARLAANIGIHLTRHESGLQAILEAGTLCIVRLRPENGVDGCAVLFGIDPETGGYFYSAPGSVGIATVERVAELPFYGVKCCRQASELQQLRDALAFAVERIASGESVFRQSDAYGVGDERRKMVRLCGFAADFLLHANRRVGGDASGLLEEAANWFREESRLLEASVSASTDPGLQAENLEAAAHAEERAFASMQAAIERLNARKELSKLWFTGLNVSQLGAIHSCFNFLGIRCSVPWLYGITGHGFLFIADDKISIPPYNHNLPNDEIRRLAEHAGARIGGISRYVTGDDLREAHREAFSAARSAINNGWPCYGLGVTEGSETAVVYGYDSEGYYAHGWHGRGGGVIPWDRLGVAMCPCDGCTDWRRKNGLDGPVREGLVDLHWVEPAEPADDFTAVREGLRFALEISAPGDRRIAPGFHTGLAAYDAWIRAFENGTAFAFYIGYNVSLFYECRKHAAAFLHEAKERLCTATNAADTTGGRQPAGNLDNRLLAEAFDEAIAPYEEVASASKELDALFPWRQPDDYVRDAEKRAKAIALLRKARMAEVRGLSALQALVERLESCHE
ncbi:LamG domain-containing protein [Paenibacillus alkalitolerans]|uniref:hypothetical protein n=1 Tax=Paenibacillus alkalitolerans TaxID=2799335 RepID=UPI0018F34C08|nr:hypothetical protein [Paenibacillus alkalitolerans]